MSEINYNDGSVHGWNGGDMPIHPKTLVTYWTDNVIGASALAGTLNWKPSWLNKNTAVRAFRVIKPYVEPREFWVAKDAGVLLAINDDYQRLLEQCNKLGATVNTTIFKVVEVLE